MKKRIFSLFLVFYILILNVAPVFAIDSYSSDHFLGVVNDYMTNDILNFINNDLTDKKYHFFILDRDFSRYMFILKSNTVLDYEFLSGDNSTITITNNSSEDDYLYSLPDFLYSFVIPAGESVTWHPGGYNPIFYENDLLIVDGNCVSKTYCSPDIYVDLETEGDYEEDGVVIKGLTSFFNNVTSKLNSIVDDLITKLKELIGLPPDGYFNSKFEEIKTNLDNKYNFSSVFEIFNNLKSIQAQKPVFDKTFNFSFDDINIPFHFKIDFDFIDSIRDYLFAFIRAFGYFYLIIYNMNQYYLLFRGQRFFYDMRDSYSYTDSNGKEHSHERGEKKWY